MDKRLLMLFSLLFFLFPRAASAAHVRAFPDSAPTVLVIAEPVALPILMYHQMLPESSKRSRYVVTPGDFENDLKLLAKHGYTTVTVKDVLDFVNKKKSLPDKPIMLTFDDGFESDYVYAFPLLQKYNAKAVFSIIGKYADLYSGDIVKDISYSHLSWAQIKEMYDSGLAEFHNHTYDMHNAQKRNGALRRRGESSEAYEKAIGNDFKLLNDKYYNHIGTVPAAFTCPYGAFNEDLRQAVKRFGYNAILTSQERVNILTGEPEELYRLGRFVRTHSMNLEKQLKLWENASQAT